MRNFNQYIRKNWPLILLILSIVMIRLPPFYVTPLQTSLLMSHTLARVFILAILSNYLLQKKKPQPAMALQILLIFWFVTQSISVVRAINIDSFIDVYKDIVFGVLIFFSAFYTVTNKNILLLMKFLLAASGLHILFQLGIYFLPNITLTVFQDIIHTPYWDIFFYQFNRGRFFGDSLDEVVIPILFFLILVKPAWKKTVLLLMLLAGITFITFASNWRSKLGLYILAFLGTFFVFQKSQLKKLSVFAIVIFIFIVLSNFLSLETSGRNVVDRIVSTNVDETKPIIARFNYWKEATEMGLKSPFTGVGLGNYFDHLSSNSQNMAKSSQLDRYSNVVIIEDPHNIFFSTFATTGFLGLSSLISLLMYFAYRDIKYFFTSTQLIQVWIVLFWVIFAYCLFNPWAYFGYLGFFWFSRGVLEKLYIRHD